MLALFVVKVAVHLGQSKNKRSNESPVNRTEVRLSQFWSQPVSYRFFSYDLMPLPGLVSVWKIGVHILLTGKLLSHIYLNNVTGIHTHFLYFTARWMGSNMIHKYHM